MALMVFMIAGPGCNDGCARVKGKEKEIEIEMEKEIEKGRETEMKSYTWVAGWSGVGLLIDSYVTRRSGSDDSIQKPRCPYLHLESSRNPFNPPTFSLLSSLRMQSGNRPDASVVRCDIFMSA